MFTATNLHAQFDDINEYWSPKIIAQVNDQFVKIAKVKGELTWHNHENEDELFFVVKGKLVIEFEDGEVSLSEGDMYTVPKGVMHNPLAQEECWIMLIETVSTLHTGDKTIDKTKTIEQQLG